MEEWKSVFDAIKQYLTEPSILSSLEVGEELYMYLVVSNYSISVVLFDKSQKMGKTSSTTLVKLWWTLRPVTLK